MKTVIVIKEYPDGRRRVESELNDKEETVNYLIQTAHQLCGFEVAIMVTDELSKGTK